VNRTAKENLLFIINAADVINGKVCFVGFRVIWRKYMSV
jgi:hypothetical protein